MSTGAVVISTRSGESEDAPGTFGTRTRNRKGRSVSQRLVGFSPGSILLTGQVRLHDQQCEKAASPANSSKRDQVCSGEATINGPEATARRSASRHTNSIGGVPCPTEGTGRKIVPRTAAKVRITSVQWRCETGREELRRPPVPWTERVALEQDDRPVAMKVCPKAGVTKLRLDGARESGYVAEIVQMGMD